jgi:two-component system chemotaxis sensor kinase CheA
LALFAEQITSLSQRLNKGDVTVHIDDGGVRLPRDCLTGFWSNFSHVVRNAIDHGLEMPDERKQHSKSEFGQIELMTRIERGEVIIQLVDDGRGIDWTHVAERAASMGLPTKTRQDLESALFADGLSTRAEATELSGRGVGLAAVKNTVKAMGGRISVESSIGHGTRFTFTLSLARLRPSCVPAAPASQRAS